MEYDHYTVRSRDSLAEIARAKLGHTHLWPILYEFNNRDQVVHITKTRIQDPDRIHVGQSILIPLLRHHTEPSRYFSPTSQTPLRHQITRPHIPLQTQPAAERSGSFSNHTVRASTTTLKQTTVNTFPYKYTLDLMPAHELVGPNFVATIKFQGTIYCWVDKQIDLLTITNKGAEAAAKSDYDAGLVKMMSQEKISWDSGSKKLSYENLFTEQAKGLPPNVISSGLYADTSNPIPAYRVKLTYPKLEFKVVSTIWLAENFAVTIDIRPKSNDNDQDPRSFRLAIQAGDLDESLAARVGHFTERNALYLLGGAIVAGVFASNFLTFGADIPADAPAGALTALLFRTAATVR